MHTAASTILNLLGHIKNTFFIHFPSFIVKISKKIELAFLRFNILMTYNTYLKQLIHNNIYLIEIKFPKSFMSNKYNNFANKREIK